jgi:hypothetical protein
MDGIKEVERSIKPYAAGTAYQAQALAPQYRERMDWTDIVAWGAVGVGIMALCWVAYVGAMALGQLAAR